MDMLIYVANGLYLGSYLVKDILALRVLTIVAAICLALYFASRPEPLVEVVCWNLVFLAMNAIQIGRLVWQRRGDAWRGSPAAPVNAPA